MINHDQYDAYLNRNINYKLKAVMFTIVALLLVFSTSDLPNKPHFFSTFDENELARRLFGDPTIQTSV